MKLRIKGNSLRLRMTRSEVARLQTAGFVEEYAEFAPGECLTYRVVASRSGPPLQTTFHTGQITVCICDDSVQRWASSDEVGIYGQSQSMEVAVEKDFRCLSRTEERDDLDVYPNPAAEEPGGAACERAKGRESQEFSPVVHLRRTHREIEDCLSVLLEIVRRRRGAPLAISDLTRATHAMEFFREQLPIHTADEEQTIFPMLRRAIGATTAETLRLIDSLEDEHICADTLHADIDRMFCCWMGQQTLRTADLEDRLESLATVYDRHIQTEESEIFPAVTRVLSAADLSAIGAEMAARRPVHF